jgi:hypothetical protein
VVATAVVFARRSKQPTTSAQTTTLCPNSHSQWPAPPRQEKLLKQPPPLPLPLLNRKQSIEDLEAKLSSRWGTIDPNHEDDDYKLVSEVKDDEKEWKLDAPVRRRARPVRDPWQKNSSPVEMLRMTLLNEISNCVNDG